MWATYRLRIVRLSTIVIVLLILSDRPVTHVRRPGSLGRHGASASARICSLGNLFVAKILMVLCRPAVESQQASGVQY